MVFGRNNSMETGHFNKIVRENNTILLTPDELSLLLFCLLPFATAVLTDISSRASLVNFPSFNSH